VTAVNPTFYNHTIKPNNTNIDIESSWPDKRRKSCLWCFWILILLIIIGACVGGPLGAILGKKGREAHKEEGHNRLNETQRQPVSGTNETQTSNVAKTQQPTTSNEVQEAPTETQVVVVNAPTKGPISQFLSGWFGWLSWF
jgi:hypothetical protein